MSERVWYRSLYWRIALGIIALLAAMLVVQGVFFVWMVTRTPDALPPRALMQTARALALELETALGQDASLDLQRFVQDRVHALSRPLLIVWHDGRVFSAGMDQPPAWIVDAAKARLQRRAGPRARMPPPGLGFSPIVVSGEPVGVLAVLPGPPLRSVFRQLGPMLLAVALVLTLGGAAIAALLVFGPAQRRLRGLEEAARRLGAGQSDARAPEAGGDEIAAVAKTFNAMAAEITRRSEALQAADRARRQLLADVSHELMTPLTAMRGYLETLRMADPRIPETARDRYLGIVLEETLNLERLIGDLLDLARLEAGGGAFSTGPVLVADLFERVRSRHGRALEEHGVELLTVIAPGAERLDGDADRLEQALQNLAANALRHTPRGGRISLEAAPAPPAHVRLAVKDTGEGIAAEHLPHVFDRFYKADAARAGSGGSGLGLSIVKAIVERHGGEVRARSQPKTETVFEMVLPRATPPGLASRPDGSPSSPARPRP